MSTNYKPFKVTNRLVIIDFLRGFALLGILMVNLSLMNAPFTSEVGEFAIWTDPVNKTFGNVIKFFFTGKFYPLFSILFGIGFYFFMKKFDEVKEPILPLFRIRLAWLLLFGIMHVLFLWYGDILIIYALMGFVLMLFRRKSNKALLKWAIALVLAPIVFVGIVVVFINLAKSMPESAEMMQAGFDEANFQMAELTKQALDTYPNGSFTDIFRMRMREYQFILNSLLIFFPNVMAFFLVGVILGKKRVFSDIKANRVLFKKLIIYSLPIAIAGNILYVYTVQYVSYVTIDYHLLLYTASSSIAGPAMTLVYISVFALLLQRIKTNKLVEAVSRTGRMALTNYLMQSLICTTLFFSYGLGLYGKVNIWQGVIIVLAVYLLEVVCSYYWLKHYRFGPMEWLWRSLTYRKLQKMSLN